MSQKSINNEYSHPFVITSTKSKVQQQPSNICTYWCTASELLLLNIRAFGDKCRLSRMLYHKYAVYIIDLQDVCVCVCVCVCARLCVRESERGRARQGDR